MTGKVPFEAVDGACPQLFEVAPRLRDVSAGYAAVVAACLEREPGKRPQSVHEVARRLREVDGERITEDVGPVVRVPPVPVHPSRRGMPIVLGAAGVLAAGGVIAWRLGGSSTPRPAVIAEAPAPVTAPPSAPPVTPAPTVPQPVPPVPQPAPAPATLDVRSFPAAAAISIAGKRVGVTPATLAVALPATLIVSHPGYRSAKVRAERAGLVDVHLIPIQPHVYSPRRAGETLD